MELEGKIIAYIRREDETGYDEKPVCIAIVTGYDPDIGITIQDAFNNNAYLYCLSGPSSVEGKGMADRYPHRYFNLSFEFATSMIENGYFNSQMDRENDESIGERGGGGASAGTCPFGQ